MTGLPCRDMVAYMLKSFPIVTIGPWPGECAVGVFGTVRRPQDGSGRGREAVRQRRAGRGTAAQFGDRGVREPQNHIRCRVVVGNPQRQYGAKAIRENRKMEAGRIGRWRTGIACVFAGLAMVSVACAEAANLVVENRNTWDDDEIKGVYVAPVGVAGWGANRIWQPIPVGEYIEIDLQSFGDGICWFDVRIVDVDDEKYVYQELNLCRTPVLTFDERHF